MTMPALRFRAFAIAMVSSILAPATGHTDSATFSAQRYPFLPELTVNERPEVCERLLKGVRRLYLAAETDIYLVEADRPLPLDETTGPAGQWLGFETPAAQSMLVKVGDEIHSFSTLRWDIDGNGERETLISFHRTLSGTYHYELHAIPASLVQGPSDEPPIEYLPDQTLVGQISDSGIEVIGAYAPFVLFSHDGELLAHATRSRFSISDPMTVTKLTLGRRREVVCSISLLPQRGPEKEAVEARLAGSPWLAAFLDIAPLIMGRGDDCGTSRAGTWHAIAFWNAVWTRLYRPWAEVSATTSRDDLGLWAENKVLRLWANSGLWERRTYRRFSTARERVLPELSRWYEERFGLPEEDAEGWAKIALLELTASLTDGPNARGAYLETNSAFDRKSVDLRLRLLDGEPTNAIARLLLASPNISLIQDFFAVAEPALFYALEHPRLVKLLLAHGADPNESNHFGKTALMYAAQFNLLETARLLLRAGADPNMQTAALPRACTRFKWIGRTALMYAAENADEAMMALLMENGADLAARDVTDYRSGAGRPDRGISDYLALNNALSESDQRRIAERWGLPR